MSAPEEPKDVKLTNRELCTLSFGLGLAAGQGLLTVEATKALAMKLNNAFSWEP